jgi:hypothetical protein
MPSTDDCCASSPEARDAEETAAFLVARVRAARGRRWDEGAWPMPLARDVPTPALEVFATRRVRGVSPTIARGLLAWARAERPADLLRDAPTPREVLERQARGRRCVSLLDDDAARARGNPLHPDGLSFALHDLAHLEKLVAPAHYLGQVGFFRCMRRALAHPEMAALEATFDAAWIADRDYVVADMNGSAVFLFSVLKMRLAMAVRRRHARAEGRAAPTEGGLDAQERAAAAPALATLFAAMGLPAQLGEEARLVSANRLHPEHARRLLAYFEGEAEPRDARFAFV